MSFQTSSLGLLCVWILEPSPHIASHLSKLKKGSWVCTPWWPILTHQQESSLLGWSEHHWSAPAFSSQAAVQDRLNEQEGVPSVFNPPPSRPLQVNTADHRIYSYVVSRPQPRASYFTAGTTPFFYFKRSFTWLCWSLYGRSKRNIENINLLAWRSSLVDLLGLSFFSWFLSEPTEVTILFFTFLHQLLEEFSMPCFVFMTLYLYVFTCLKMFALCLVDPVLLS